MGPVRAGKAIALLAYENFPNSRLGLVHLGAPNWRCSGRYYPTAARRGAGHGQMASFLFRIGHPAHG